MIGTAPIKSESSIEDRLITIEMRIDNIENVIMHIKDKIDSLDNRTCGLQKLGFAADKYLNDPNIQTLNLKHFEGS